MDEMLEYTAVRHVDLTQLREAVEKWQKLPGKIDGVATTFGRTVATPLEQSGWYGETAQAAFKKFTGVRRQMAEASGEAKRIGTVMSQALKVFEDAKEELKKIEQEVENPPTGGGPNYLKLNKQTGEVYVDPPDSEKGNSAGIQKAFHDTLVHYKKRTTDALKAAGEADHDLKTALQLNPPGKGFNDDIPANLKDVDAETKRDVDALMKLAEHDDFKKNAKLLSQFNGILAKNAQNADFAEQFATRKGAKGILDFWYKTAQPEYGDGPFMEPKDRPAGVTKQLAALQDNLGNTLALASRSDSPEMAQWKKDVIELGDKRMAGFQGAYNSQPPYGFQVMSNLMRTGKWDTGFLHDYGDKLVKFDKEPFINPGGREEEGHRKWLSYGRMPNDFLNFGPKYDKGEDPFTGYLEALGHNSNASTDFFKDKDKFDYLLRERTWLPDGDPPSEGEHKGETGPRIALGHALNSATTGHDWDAPLPMNASHTKDQAHIMEELIKGVASKDDHIKLAPGMHEGVGRAAAEYTPDLFRALREGSGDEKLFPMKGTQAEFDHVDATRFLVTLGQDPEANAALTHAQKVYTAQSLEHALAGDLPADQKYDASTRDTVQQILRTSGETSGTLAIGRQEAIISKAIESDAKFEQQTLHARLWGNTGFGGAVAAATAYAKWFPNPVIAATVGALTSGAEGALANDWDASVSHNTGAEKADYAGRLYSKMREQDITTNEKILEAIEKKHNVDTSSAWANTFTYEGFGLAKDSVESTAPYLTSIDQVKSLPADRPD
ncbi:WXG100 family type VII secretion target [Streptomyces albus]|uniref:WXG100 family type VII secretion target n=1 Tax=Streptomyces albus TaxID=1888 RepID=UPI0024E11964|nr:hypothetical protein [Streptomyces albus]GHJ23212.1 hypothetical protein TPA0909_48260 [Streptomyces albus]